MTRLYTVRQLGIDIEPQEEVEAESIFDVPAAYLKAHYRDAATIVKDVRQGELAVMGDRRRWFLHTVRFELANELVDLSIIVTADEAV